MYGWNAGNLIERMIFVEDNGAFRRDQVTTNIPRFAESYFAVSSKIDEHNRARQDGLQLERKQRFDEWNKRVNTTFYRHRTPSTVICLDLSLKMNGALSI